MLELGQAGDALGELLALFAGHEGAEDDQRRQVDGAVGLVGRDHPVDHAGAIAAAAGRDQDERALGDAGMPVGRHGRGHCALEITGVADLVGKEMLVRQPFERPVDALQPVDPDVVIGAGEHVESAALAPFLMQLGRLVENVAQAEHDAGAAPAQDLQRRDELAAQADRLLVDDDDVGVEGQNRLLDQLGA